jgi:FkbM family methyltransferase
VRLPGWGLQVLLDAKWQGIGRLVFAFRQYYEPELEYLNSLLFPGATFVDVGANLGIYTLVASRIVGHLGHVISFEPSVQSFPLLQTNIALNGLTNVSAFPIALSERAGKVRLYHAPCCPSGNSFAYQPSFPESFENVVAERLDDVLQRIPAGRVDVIKVDVQGAEELVLRSAQKVIASAHPVIVFEFWPEGASLLGLSPYGAWNLLAGLGYRFFTVCSASAAFGIESPPTGTEYANVLGIPQEK